MSFLLYVTVVAIAACGLAYELVAGAVASYMLSDSVTQLSIIIGLHLSAMGVGAWLSRFVEERLAERFIDCQLAASLIGGLGGPILYLAFALGAPVRPVILLVVATAGVLLGAELPLLMRVLKRRFSLHDAVPRVLSLDYIGALLGSLLFALVLLPQLGILRAAIAFGLLGVLAALWGIQVFESLLEPRPLRVRASVVGAILAVAMIGSKQLSSAADESLLQQPILHTTQSDYQRIVVTRSRGGVNLYLDGNLQFSSLDEHRYHEALVHPPMSAAQRRARVLVLGGGDGLAVREILRWPEVEAVTLVDLDPKMTELCRTLPALREQNQGALDDPRVTIINTDAMLWLAEAPRDAQHTFDAVIVDFPDPNHFALGKLYTVRFYKLLRERLAEGAAVAVQSTSPLIAPRSYWCIMQTMELAGFSVRPYHALVPSFGEWGYALAAIGRAPEPSALPSGLRYLNADVMRSLFDFPRDMQRVKVEPNRLNNQMLVRYYDEEWRRWQQ